MPQFTNESYICEQNLLLDRVIFLIILAENRTIYANYLMQIIFLIPLTISTISTIAQ